MKITLTGSLGNIGKPLTKELVEKGHTITVISSDPEKRKAIEAMGAIAAIGNLEEVSFLTDAFSGADAVYIMIPPANYFDPGIDPIAYCEKIGNSCAKAIQQSGVKRVVDLSSIGAHLERGSGIILGHHKVEVILDKLSDVAITFIRPVGIYSNLLGFVSVIKSAGMITSNYGADDKLIWVSPKDIAAVVAEELETVQVGRKIRYVASDELTGNETARILGSAIGKPDLKWKLIPDKQWQNGLEAAGMNPKAASGLVEMFASQHNGLLNEDYYRHKPTLMGKVKLTDFAKEFAASFNAN
jgi:uncharacterized protein YbjT (DUF2867 family)